MKNSTLLMLSILLPATACYSQVKVVAVISNLKNDKGVCRACLFNNQAAFTGESGTPYKCVSSGITGNKSNAVFENVATGSYALFVFHDANGNNKIDKNFLGMPKEGYGASKNKLPFAAAPKFDENKFLVSNKPVELNIQIRNLF